MVGIGLVVVGGAVGGGVVGEGGAGIMSHFNGPWPEKLSSCPLSKSSSNSSFPF